MNNQFHVNSIQVGRKQFDKKSVAFQIFFGPKRKMNFGNKCKLQWLKEVT